MLIHGEFLPVPSTDFTLHSPRLWHSDPLEWVRLNCLWTWGCTLLRTLWIDDTGMSRSERTEHIKSLILWIMNIKEEGENRYRIVSIFFQSQELCTSYCKLWYYFKIKQGTLLYDWLYSVLRRIGNISAK